MCGTVRNICIRGRSCNYEVVDDSSDVSTRLEELLNELRSRSGLTTLDLVSGYYQVPFRTQKGIQFQCDLKLIE